jgi:hypothetical protein
MAPEFGGLVDAENGLISRRIFIEPEIYAQELERIFARFWLFLCHMAQLQSGRIIHIHQKPVCHCSWRCRSHPRTRLHQSNWFSTTAQVTISVVDVTTSGAVP